MKCKILVIAIIALVLIVILGLIACNDNVIIQKYTISSSKVKEIIRIIQISDLHNSDYGEGGEELIKLIDNTNPHIVVMTGDIFDSSVSDNNPLQLIEKLTKKYHCYFVLGNHEVSNKDFENIKKSLLQFGVKILEGECEYVEIGSQKIMIAGINDPLAPTSKGGEWEKQLMKCNEQVDENVFSILLTHRNDRVPQYEKTDFDLILAGHAHGGQVRLPYIINGLYTRQQGIFPQYAGGQYSLDNKSIMIVNRGLSKLVKPRVFNRPELLLIVLMPKK